MSNLIPGNQKHLRLDERLFIEKSLNEGRSFKDIARYLCKDPTTISKEVKLHRLSDWYHKRTFDNALDGRTPYDVALKTYGESTLKTLQLRRIAPDEVNLTPKLIKFNRYPSHINLLSDWK